MMKWRVRRDSQSSFVEPEEVRRSIEVLDEVLAQFDDVATSQVENRDDYSSTNNWLVDGATSSNINTEQAPPIPQRSPTTRLSRDHGLRNKAHIPDSSHLVDSVQSADDQCQTKKASPEVFQQVKASSDSQPKTIEVTIGNSQTPPNVKIRNVENEFYSSSDDSEKENKGSKQQGRNDDSFPCLCQDKLNQLRLKFANVLLLLMTNKLKELDKEPPEFIPPSPPPNHQIKLYSCPKKNSQAKNTPKDDTTDSFSEIKSSSCTPRFHSTAIDDSSPKKSLGIFADVSAIEETRSFDECSYRTCHSEEANKRLSIGDLPHLLPTDVLQRPQLGLSYSLEEDLSPGIKEIRTSTPLSTFSHSGSSSLGYISSQSDLDLSSMPDKVPLSSFKSLTLPTGRPNHSPFYSDADGPNPVFNQHSSLTKKDTLSGSTEKSKNKLFRVFSKKKKDAKSDDSSSLKSDTSLDEGFLQNISVIKERLTSTDIMQNMEPMNEKKRGIWRSVKKKQIS